MAKWLIALLMVVSFGSFAKDPVVFREGYLFEAIMSGSVVHVKTFDSGFNCNYDRRENGVSDNMGRYYTLAYTCWSYKASYRTLYISYYYEPDLFDLVLRNYTDGPIIYEGIWPAAEVLR